MEQKIVFATGNEGKMREVRLILQDLGFPVLSMKEAGVSLDIEENGTTFAENAMIKATEIAKIANQMPEYKNAVVLADDSGLEIDYLNKHGFSADFTKLKYSYNVGLWGTSICGGEILDSAQGLPETAYLKHVEKEGSEQLRLTFEKGELKAVNDETFDDPIQAIQKVEEIGAAYGIGRDMHVGDTIIGIKGRVGFEAAAPMLIIGAHRFLEKYTLSKWQQYWKDQVANWYGMFLHESQYLEPVMRDIEAMLQESQRNVNGTVILELRPLSFSTVGVDSKDDLVKTKFGEYGEMQKGWTAEDAKGFIKVTSTPLRVYYNNHKDEEI